MKKIKFGTDGWRAATAKEFTAYNVARVAEATAIWVKQNGLPMRAVVGHDCRFGGELFAETVARVFLANGMEVHLSEGPVTTPMVSLGAKELDCGIGVIITASHNPPSDNGFKLKGAHGGPLLEADVKAVEDLIPAELSTDPDSINLAEKRASGQLITAELEDMFVEKIEANFDLDAIRNSKMELAYDAMYGSGQYVMRRLFPDITLVHCERDAWFGGVSPEPIHRNCQEFSEMIKLAGDIDCGLVNDGDADRIGLYDGEGNFVDPHHILLLLIHYLHKYKGMRGKVGTGFSSTVKIHQLCAHYGIEVDVVKIGFKHLCGIMITDDVLVGGEESGGIAVKGHIPERDGIWNGLVLWEFMAKSGKTLRELIQEVYDIVGAFAFERIDLRIDEALKQSIVAKCAAGEFNSFGDRQVVKIDDMDGWKYWLSDHEWVMIRPSGTEPVLRTYAEAATQADAFAILEDCRKTIGA
ncbi:MAG: phosphomannomutase [Bacteroidia bacterium]|jgi:phosphomannomutase